MPLDTNNEQVTNEISIAHSLSSERKRRLPADDRDTVGIETPARRPELHAKGAAPSGPEKCLPE